MTPSVAAIVLDWCRGPLLWRRSVEHLLPSLPVRSRIKTLVGRLGRTKAGRTALLAATVGDPRELRFSTARWWPDETRGFEDLAFLFTSSQLNHGIISQELDEAALLYRLARDAVRQVPGWTVAGCDTPAVSPELTFDTSADWADIGSADCLSNDHSCRMAK